MSTGVMSARRAKISARTLRTDRWWFPPLVTVVGLGAWVTGVNAKGGFGVWCHDVAYEMATIQDILERYGAPVPA